MKERGPNDKGETYDRGRRKVEKGVQLGEISK